ncbi:hypothetical protein GCM10009601_39270 [Streptomyces thermospinosisporus]|uniref:Uncharacterized protein n=1 Tax=Streptomyces thermospinosisporus TaxID=161482 RepID=A0ABP4JSQ0_9ACTN
MAGSYSAGGTPDTSGERDAGAPAVSAECHDGAPRLSLTAVPHRARCSAAKALAVAVPAPLVGLLTTLAALLAARAGPEAGRA